MFGIGTGEIIAILVITMLVVGPERMVELAGTMGRMIAKFRQETDSMTKEFREALSIEELQDALDQAKREASEIGGAIEGTAAEVRGEAESIAAAVELPDATPAAATAVAPTSAAAPAPARPAATPAQAALAHAPAEEPEPEEPDAPLFLEGELEIHVAEEPSPVGPSIEQLEQASPVLIHTALLVPDDREPEDIEIDLIEPTVVGPVLMAEEEPEPADPSDAPVNEVEASENAGTEENGDVEAQPVKAPKNEG